MYWLLIAIIAVLSWFSWILIHEFSHLIAIKYYRNVVSWKIWPFPHKYENKWYWARVEWQHDLPELNNQEKFWVKISPRIPNMISAICFSLSFLLPAFLVTFWCIFWGAGIIDFFVGSIGYSEQSDLKTASKAVGANPAILRIAGFTIIAFSLVFGLLLL